VWFWLLMAVDLSFITWTLVFDGIADLMRMLDIYMRLVHFAEPGTQGAVLLPAEVWPTYKKVFALDLLAACPLDWITLAAVQPLSVSMTLVYWLRITRLVGLHRMSDLQRYGESWLESQQTNIKPNVMRIMKTYLALAMFIHWFSCFWFGWAVIEDSKRSWTVQASKPVFADLLQKPLGFRYLYSTYFCVVSMTGVGYGDIQPSTGMVRMLVVDC